MELGEKLRLARLEAGLSQRQLCGEEITRNMLSQIEHGTAQPSMKTLQYLASRLEKPVGYFLEDGVQPSGYQLLEGISLLAEAEDAIAQEKFLYARQLLERAEKAFREAPFDLERRRLLLLGRLPGENLIPLCEALPGLEEELYLRAEAALVREDPDRAEALLAAAEERESPRWNLLQGKTLLLKKQYATAIPYLQRAEEGYPKEIAPLLEAAFRELGDFQKAYFYACKQR